jgi:hypothetical protein
MTPDDPDRRRRGRPSIGGTDDPSVHVGVRLGKAYYDVLCRQAKREGVSVPELIRRGLNKNPKNRQS